MYNSKLRGIFAGRRMASWRKRRNDRRLPTFPRRLGRKRNKRESKLFDFYYKVAIENVFSPQKSEAESIVSNIKESGNEFYKTENFVEADRKYRKTLRYIQFLNSKGILQKVDGRVKDIEVQSLLNLAAVRLKRQRYQDALNCCNHVSGRNHRKSKNIVELWRI